MLINYDSYDAVRQALAHAEKFITQATGGFFIGTPVAAGISVPVPGVDGVSYTLGLNPHEPVGIFARVDGMPGGRQIWRHDFQREDGHLDARRLVWAAGGHYAEGPIALPTIDRWLFLRGVRLRWRPSLLEAGVAGVRPLALAGGALHPEALSEIEVTIDTSYGRHALRVPVDGDLPPGCGMLQPGGKLFLGLCRFAFDVAAVMAILLADHLAVAMNSDQQREVA